MTTDADRKRMELQRKRLAGLVSVQVWVRPEYAPQIQELAHRLRQLPPNPALAKLRPKRWQPPQPPE
jgi:hypothetical protein